MISPGLLAPPAKMEPWQMRVTVHRPTEFGKFVLVDLYPNEVEQEHCVIVYDEDDSPIFPRVRVIFGDPGGGGDHIDIGGRARYWDETVGAPAVLRGKAVYTRVGVARLVTGGNGGQDIWVHDVDAASGHILYSSDIVRNCMSIDTSKVGGNIHQGVVVVFQLQRVGRVPLERRLRELEKYLPKTYAAPEKNKIYNVEGTQQ